MSARISDFLPTVFFLYRTEKHLRLLELEGIKSVNRVLKFSQIGLIRSIRIDFTFRPRRV